MSCNGDGWCFAQNGNDRYYKKYKCKFRCKLKKCPNCNCKDPQCMLNCHEGLCMECAIFGKCDK